MEGRLARQAAEGHAAPRRTPSHHSLATSGTATGPKRSGARGMEPSSWAHACLSRPQRFNADAPALTKKMP